MLRCPRAVLIALVAAMPLAACSSGFDPENITDKLDFLNPKKKLPGDRKAVFPGGVPGITQGVPPELVKGNQPPPESQTAAVADPQAAPPPGGSSGQAAAAQPGAEPAQEPPPKPKRVAAKPKPKPQPRPQAEPVQEPQQQAQPARSPQQQLAPWPGSPPPQSTAQPGWPSSPAPGTFQR
jgi:hypothetical protein